MHISDDQIDQLVHSFLAAESQQVDISAQLEAIESRMAASPPKLVASRWPNRRLGWVVSLAASVLVAACGFYFLFWPQTTSAYSAVMAVQEAFVPHVERCYRLEVDVPPAWLKSHSLLNIGSGARLWTSGDLFRVEDPRDAGKLIWGQDSAGHVWFSCFGEYGLEFDRQNTPSMIKMSRSFLHLDMARLMERFLRSFDLTLEPPEFGVGTNLLVVRALARPDGEHVQMNAARLEIERGTNVIRRLELSRVVRGATKGTVTFVLERSTTASESEYRLSGQLPVSAPVYRGEEALARFQQLKAVLRP